MQSRIGPKLAFYGVLPSCYGTNGKYFFIFWREDRRTDPQTVTRFAGQRVAGDKG